MQHSSHFCTLHITANCLFKKKKKKKLHWIFNHLGGKEVSSWCGRKAVDIQRDCWLGDAKDAVLEASVPHAAHSWRDLEAGRFTLPPVSPAGNVSHLQVCVLRVTPRLTAFISQCAVEMLCTCFCRPDGRAQTPRFSKDENRNRTQSFVFVCHASMQRVKAKSMQTSIHCLRTLHCIHLNLTSRPTFSDRPDCQCFAMICIVLSC